MSTEDTPSPAAVSGVADDTKESNANAAITETQSSNEEGAASSNSNELSNSMQPRLRVHGEDSVAYITVSDPVQHTEGIKGKYTMYRVAYGKNNNMEQIILRMQHL